MVNRKIIFSTGEFYHIYNRGNDHRVIFADSNDYQRFIKLLFLCNGSAPVVFREISQGDTFVFDRGETLVDIGAYCLMPNHFHLLIREKTGSGITAFLKKLATAYSMYFNLKNERTGKLFEGVFRAEHAGQDDYLRYLFAYIHLNPIKLIDPEWKKTKISDREKAWKYLTRYVYSSLPEYLGQQRNEKAILNIEKFPDYFADQKDFKNFLDDWISFAESELPR